jgi:hypothetical protein
MFWWGPIHFMQHNCLAHVHTGPSKFVQNGKRRRVKALQCRGIQYNLRRLRRQALGQLGQTGVGTKMG